MKNELKVIDKVFEDNITLIIVINKSILEKINSYGLKYEVLEDNYYRL